MIGKKMKNNKIIVALLSVAVILLLVIVGVLIIKGVPGNSAKSVEEEKAAKVNNQPFVEVVPASAYASSVLPASYGFRYPPEYSFDNDPFTWWSPSGTYHGQWITYSLPRPMEVNGISIWNGSHYPNFSNGGYYFGDLYYQNAILTSATLEFSDGTRREVLFKIYDGMQTVNFPPVVTTHVKMLCTGVSPGQRWQDVCISEFRVMGRNAQ